MRAENSVKHVAARRGFSLIELALVLGISGLMLGFVLQSQQSAAVADCYAATKLQLRDIDGAIQRFARQRERLPLPAARNVGVEGVTYGREASGGAIDAAGGASWGALPFQALGLAPSYASDCWGNKLTYVVTTALTTNAISGGYLDYNIVGNITVRKDASTNSSTTAAYAVISHGEDALGAVKNNYSSGAKGWCTGAATLATQNCLANAATIASATFNNGKDAGANYFDDVIVSRGRPVTPTVSGTSNLFCWGTDFLGYGALADGSLATGATHQKLAPTASTSSLLFAKLAETQGDTYYNYHMCTLTSDGTPYCWGLNANGQLGDASTTNRAVPTAVNTTVKFAKIYVFGNVTCGLQRNLDGSVEGTPYCWGASINGTGAQRTSPVAVNVGGAKLTMITGGSNSSGQPILCGLATNGDAYCWSSSHRGDGTSSGTLLPTLVTGGRKFADILAGAPTCGITSAADPGGAGALYCWGALGTFNNSTPATLFPDVAIAGISNTNPVVVTTATNHGMAAGDQFTIRHVKGMGYINERATAFCTGVGTPLSTCTAANTLARIFNTSTNGSARWTVTAGNFTANTITIPGLDGTTLGTYTSGGRLTAYSVSSPRLMPSFGIPFSNFIRTKSNYYGSIGFAALTTTGRMFSWGDNNNNEFGNPSALGAELPRKLLGGTYPTQMTATNPIVVNSTAHGLSVGDVVYHKAGIGFVQMVDGLYRVGSVPNANQFTLQDMNGNNIDATSFRNSSGTTACCTGGDFYLVADNICYLDANTRMKSCNQNPQAPLGVCVSESGGQCTFTSPEKVAIGTATAAITNANTQIGWMSYAGDNTTSTRTSPVLMRTSTNATLPFSFDRFLPLNMDNITGMCGLSTANDLYCWGGTNTSGVYGSGDTTAAAFPRIVTGGLKFASLAYLSNGNSSNQHGVVCALKQTCTPDGQPSGGNPASCCNGDSDGNGTCGTQASCTPCVTYQGSELDLYGTFNGGAGCWNYTKADCSTEGDAAPCDGTTTTPPAGWSVCP